MSRFKKTVAAILCVVTLLSFTACSSGADMTWAAKSGEHVVPTGVYLEYLLNAYYDAVDYSGSNPKDIFNQQVNGMPAYDYMIDNAQSFVKRYIALQQKFKELGLEMTEEDQKSIEAAVDKQLTDLGDLYEKNGIGRQSLIESYKVDYWEGKISDAYFGENGLTPISEEELKTSFKENYAKMSYIVFQKIDEQRQPLPEETIEKFRGQAQDVVKRAEAGEVLNDIVKEIAVESKQDPAAIEPVVIHKVYNNMETKFTEQLFEAPYDKPTFFETDYFMYAYVRHDQNSDPADLEDNKELVKAYLTAEKYQALIKEWTDVITVEYNEPVTKKYTPKKIQY